MATASPTTNPTAAPILNLDTLAVRSSVAINGVKYGLRHTDELSVVQAHRLGRYAERYDELVEVTKTGQALSEEDAQELADALEAIAPIALDAPPDVLQALTDLQRFQVVQTFISLSPIRRRPTRAIPAASAAPSTGEKPRRGSRASTAGRRRTG